MKNNDRRNFLKNALTLSAMSVIAPGIVSAGTNSYDNAHNLDDGQGVKFLFQGDSITDSGRMNSADMDHALGNGYAHLIASRLAYTYPTKKFMFYNRGVGGNKVTELTERWQRDAINIGPDIVSILIGINDTVAGMGGNSDHTPMTFEQNYGMLLLKTHQQLPNALIVICEPFALQAGQVAQEWNKYKSELTKRQEVVKRLATEYKAVYVELQSAFNKALPRTSPEYWAPDGIHPSPAGHELIAREWTAQVSKRVKFLK